VVGSVIDAAETRRPAPSAGGTLATKPIPHLLVYALERRLTGSFEFVEGPRAVDVSLSEGSDAVRAGDVAAAVYVRGGMPAKIKTRAAVAYLGQVLYEHGAIDERQLNASLMDVATRKMLQGRALMDSGAISLDILRAGLVDQTHRKIRHLFTLPSDTQFAFFADADLLASFGDDDVVPVDPMPALWRGVRDFPSWPHVRAMLGRVERVQCVLSATANLARFKLDADELALAECLRARAMGVNEFSGLGVLVPNVAELLYYCLLITRQIEVAADARTSTVPPRPANQVAMSTAPPPTITSRPPLQPHQSGSFERPISFNMKVASPVSLPPSSASPPSVIPYAPHAPPGAVTTISSMPPQSTVIKPPVSAPPPRYTPGGSLEVSPQFAARRKQISDKLDMIQKEDFFTMLGLAREATAEDAQRAFFRLAELWHPDRLPAVLDDMRDSCATVFSHLSEAHNILSDERRRQKYIERLNDERAPTIEIASVRPVPGTANLFEGAEICASRKEWARAEALCARYIEDHPNHGPSIALFAWAQANKTENQSVEATKEQVKLLDRALTVDWEYERGYHWRALLYRRLKQENFAIKDFRAAASLNPHNIEAAREVRIFDMRKRSTPRYGQKAESPIATPPSSPPQGPSSGFPLGGAREEPPIDRKKTISGLFNKILKR
jgi:curved DNA-binding protein CbpA